MFLCASTSVCENSAGGCVAALGCFDGVHTGHRQLLARAKEQAAALGLPLAVYSPEAKKGQAFLTTPAEKTKLLHSLGADKVILADFDQIKDLSAESFVRDILIGRLNCRAAVCGYNFTFGKMASGNATTLCALMQAQDRRVLIQPPVDMDGSPVSSTRIRDLILKGEISRANTLLQRPFSLCGRVVNGRAVGRTLGFPTLNLPFPDGKLVPKAGVYYSRVQTETGLYGAVTNIGVRPTFKDTLPVPVLEAHLFDFSADLYGKEVTVELVSFLRPEIAFDSVQALMERVHRDILDAKELAASDSILSKELT